MKKRRLMYLCGMILGCGIILSGCTGSGENKPVATDNADKKTENTTDKKVDSVKKLKASEEDLKLYDELFDINNVVSVNIDIEDEELKKIQNDYENYRMMDSKSPIYRVAKKVTFKINDKTYEIEDVGIRMKGNTSRSDLYDDSKGIYKLSHFRLSFDETFDNEKYYGADVRKWTDAAKKERKKRTFASLDGIELKWNMSFDKTYIREYYVHEMYRDYGVLCQKMSITGLQLADTYMGVYDIFEPVDETFLARNLDEKDLGGDLYKASWCGHGGADYTGNVTYGVKDEDTRQFYNLSLSTNKKTSKNEQLVNMLKTINASDVSKEDFAKVVDVDNFVKFAAVQYLAGDPDDLRNNYNNHYVYFLKSSGKAVFIPYDCDRVFGCTNGLNPTGNGQTQVSPYSQTAQCGGGQQANPVYNYSICRGGYYTAEYREELLKMLDSKWVKFDNFKSIYDVVSKNYVDAVKVTKRFENARGTFELSLDGKLSTDRDNMSMEEYLKAKVATTKSKIDDYNKK